MLVAAILVTHSFFPAKLLRSIDESTCDVKWIVFFHGHSVELEKQIGDAVAERNGRYFPYGSDRGLARSWNEGLVVAQEIGADLVMLLNDDLFFYPGCFAKFVDFCAEVEAKHEVAGIVHTNGLESGGSPYAGIVQTQGFACCAILRRALDIIGYFDPEFCPAYFEDVDYARRLHLCKVGTITDVRTLVEHERGLTSRIDPDLAARNTAIAISSSVYFKEKWGGMPAEATFEIPFANPSFDNKIRFEDRLDPYGRGLEK